MSERATPAVIYAAKSTEDKHGSIPTQIEDCRALAAREGWEIVGSYEDESKSAFHGNRGPRLQAARDHAERVDGTIIVQHSDRLARGDGITADHLVELVLWARKSGVRWASVQDPQTFDGMGLVYAALMGDRNHDDSARKSAAVKSGLKRRADKGKPVGPIPLGYRAESVVVGDEVITRRVADPVVTPTVTRIFEMVEAGATFGDVARTLNAEGVPTPRGKPWVSRNVGRMVQNSAYAGQKGYPKLIEPERWQRINDGLRRLDPAAAQRRRGGRKPTDPSYWLRGTVFCLDCGAALYTRRQAVGRVYVCANRRTGTGICHADPIPATLIESHVLEHLEAFVGDAEVWLVQQARKRDDGHGQLLAAVQRLRDDRDRIDQRRERLMDDYEALPKDDPGARLLLDRAARLNMERETLTAKIADAEAVAAEWEEADDSDLSDAVDLVRALQDADTAHALNAALSRALAGIHASVKDGKLRAEFELAADLLPDHRAGVHLFQHAEPVGVDVRRIALRPDRQTGTYTLLCEKPAAYSASAPAPMPARPKRVRRLMSRRFQVPSSAIFGLPTVVARARPHRPSPLAGRCDPGATDL